MLRRLSRALREMKDVVGHMRYLHRAVRSIQGDIRVLGISVEDIFECKLRFQFMVCWWSLGFLG